MSLLIGVLDLADQPANATKCGVVILAGNRPMITAAVSHSAGKESLDIVQSSVGGLICKLGC